MRHHASIPELRAIVQAYTAHEAVGQRTALATVVAVEGSSYRKPGARMLIADDGTLTGGISGGCLEGDALRRALYVIQKQVPQLITYDTTEDGDAALGAALGCNGIIHVLLEPLELAQGRITPISLLQHVLAQRQPVCMVTVFSQQKDTPSIGTVSLVHAQKHLATTDLPTAWTEHLLLMAQNALQTRRSAFETLDAHRVFVEYVPPTVHLVVAGDGNDVVPLLAFADLLGWDTTLLDGPRSYLSKQKMLPPTCRVVRQAAGVFNQLPLDDHTAVLLMTHNFENDKALVRAAFEAFPFRYIGMLGNARKKERLADELHTAGQMPSAEQWATLHCPMGLPIGSHTPESIALSIVAQVQEVLGGGSF